MLTHHRTRNGHLDRSTQYLLWRGREQQKVLRLREARHDALHAELRAARQHRVEVDAEDASHLAGAADDVELVEESYTAIDGETGETRVDHRTYMLGTKNKSLSRRSQTAQPCSGQDACVH